jgi:mono/diheme cytochrome c family protein
MVFLSWLLAMSAAFAADGSGTTGDTDYETLIRPLLRSRCLSCHGPLRQQGGLRVDTAAALLQGGDSGPAIEPGKADSGELIARITSNDESLRMPPEGDALTSEEVALLTRWIAAGAPRPENETPDLSPSDHWAFRVPVRPDVPPAPASTDGRSVWSDSPIDAFIARRHQAEGLTPQPLAEKHVLLRRLYLDLIGLPPTPEQLDAFLADDSADAWQKVVDELLDSQHYGERWGRHWMDVWRYSDWYGYRAELRSSARHMWRWRDWIVESLNQDKPYDQIIVEMLAGDEIAPGDPDTLRATGFLARHYFKFNRNTWLDATIEHTGKAFLGLTLNCARCHDHMYDPIASREYYQYRAIFEPYNVRTDRVPGETDLTKNGLSLAFDQRPDARTFMFRRGNDKYPIEDDPLDATIPAMFGNRTFDAAPIELPVEAWYPGFREFEQQETIDAIRKAVDTKERAVEVARQKHAVAAQLVAKLQAAESSVQPAGSAAIAAKPQPQDPSSSAEPENAVLEDAFAQRRNDVWTFGPGDWEFRDGHLLQKSTGAERRSLTSKQLLPRHFSATFAFRITGGEQWKSVGLDFDVRDGDSAQSVYLSAYAGGPKLQFSHRIRGQVTYPRDAMKALPVQVGKVHTLRVDVVDRLLNVHVDGELQLKHHLPVERADGMLSIWTFDAAAEFHSVKVAELPATTKLAEPAHPASESGTPRTLADAEAALKAADRQLVAADTVLTAGRAELESVTARIAADNARYGRDTSGDATQLARVASAAEYRSRRESALAELASAEAELLAGGILPDAAAKKKAVDAANKKLAAARKAVDDLTKKPHDETSTTYSPFGPVYPRTSTGRRLALARWIASKQNPLTARVAVNQIWMRHFGEPLVPTIFDFGMNGRQPTHPELLDWLAAEFVDSGWSMKHLHRLLVLSRTYQLSSSDQDAASHNVEVDPDNRLLWHSNVRRLESEVVRDSVLAVSGTLDRKAGGPELDENTGLTTTRRSIYYRHAPEKFMTFLEQFDSASPDECYRRNETIVPQQALTLMNSQLAIEQARHLAAALMAREQPFVDSLFVRVLSRRPTDAERQTCEEFLKQQTALFTRTTDLATFDNGPQLNVAPSTDPAQRARENLAHVLLNHNDFVTVR